MTLRASGRLLSVWMLAIVSLVTGEAVQAQTASPQQCKAPLPGAAALPVLNLQLERELKDHETPSEAKRPVYMSGDHASGRAGIESSLQGKAELRANGGTIRADRITYNQDDDEVIASGNVRVAKDGNVFVGPRLQLRVAANIGVFEQPTYKLGLYRGSGSASTMEFLGPKHIRLEQATFTTCDPADPAWQIFADQLDIDELAEAGEARGARLVFGQRSLISLPVLPFPIGDSRKSGVLTPSVYLGGRLGAELIVPYYFNLAPNRDLTVQTHLSLSRGLSFGNRFRYLEKPMFGEVQLDWNPHDAVTGTQRMFISTRNSIVDIGGWNGALNASGVSDDTYLSTYSRTILASSQTKLPRELVLNRTVGDDWQLGLNVRAYQNLLGARDSLTETPFNQLPRVSIKKDFVSDSGFVFRQDAEAAHFSRHVPNTAKGQRFLSNSSVSYPVQLPGAFVIPKLSVNAARYDLDQNPGYATTFSRVLPTLSLDTGLVFERQASWRGRDVTQTLEPRLFFARTPYKDQTGIPVFDTSAASFGFSQLFNESPFLGQDRIADVNQVSLGLTTRRIESDGKESLRASIGQRFYLADQRVALPTGVAISGRQSDILMSLGTEMLENLNVDAYAQYSTDTKRFSRFSVNTHYAPDSLRLLNLGFRYLKDPRDLANQISQVDLSWRWPVASGWSTVGRINYSFLRDVVNAAGTIERPRIVEALLGVEYDWDCWVARFVAHRYVASDNKASTPLFFQLELKGLGRLGNNPFDILRRSIPGYRAPSDRPVLPNSYFGYD
jgi:LPS-assembly protein